MIESQNMRATFTLNWFLKTVLICSFVHITKLMLMYNACIKDNFESPHAGIMYSLHTFNHVKHKCKQRKIAIYNENSLVMWDYLFEHNKYNPFAWHKS